MENADVIKLRDILRKTGDNNNTPLRVYIDNSFIIIDESNKFEFTKWDDDNGILFEGEKNGTRVITCNACYKIFE